MNKEELIKHYKNLGLNPEKEITKQEIKDAYFKLLKRFHPDVYEGNPEVANNMIKGINNSYEKLMQEMTQTNNALEIYKKPEVSHFLGFDFNSKLKVAVKIIAGVLIASIIARGGYLALKRDNKFIGSSVANTETEIVVDTNETSKVNENWSTQKDIIIDANAAHKVYENWSALGASYSKEEIETIINNLNNIESNMSLEEIDEILLEILNKSITSGINNAMLGYKAYETYELNFSSLIGNNVEGKEAVVKMESYLNGMLTDPSNIKKYAENAFIQEARLLKENETVDGLNIEEGNEIVKLIWARLSIAANGIAGTLGDSLKVTVNDKIYTQDDLNDASIFERIAEIAINELSENSLN